MPITQSIKEAIKLWANRKFYDSHQIAKGIDREAIVDYLHLDCKWSLYHACQGMFYLKSPAIRGPLCEAIETKLRKHGLRLA